MGPDACAGPVSRTGGALTLRWRLTWCRASRARRSSAGAPSRGEPRAEDLDDLVALDAHRVQLALDARGRQYPRRIEDEVIAVDDDPPAGLDLHHVVHLDCVGRRRPAVGSRWSARSAPRTRWVIRTARSVTCRSAFFRPPGDPHTRGDEPTAVPIVGAAASPRCRFLPATPEPPRGRAHCERRTTARARPGGRRGRP
jgi:hypothetical protein